MPRDPRNFLTGPNMYGRPRGFSQVPGVRPPGSPMARPDLAPRLPQIPVPAYDPPGGTVAPILAPPQNALTQYTETYAAQVPLTAAERTVYTFRNYWRAADVYIDVPFLLPAGVTVTVRVYALVQGVRSLVATGRYGPNTAPSGRQWICAARGGGDRYEVTVQGFLGATGTVQAAVIGVDDAPEPPPWVGAVAINPGVAALAMTAAGEITLAGSDFQVVGLHATRIDAGAAVLWLQVHDIPAGAIPPGNAPFLSYGFAAAVGATYAMHDLAHAFFTDRTTLTGIGVGVSTSGDVFASAGAGGDIVWNVWVR